MTGRRTVQVTPEEMEALAFASGETIEFHATHAEMLSDRCRYIAPLTEAAL